ncbi:GNAT family N-acetyltransferase [Rossellomorea aquimaris]|uniref:GNAT family N-acetyltransferase n=1 Tax=Rossellomorea aquimaris TaxID=189382 RepID=A0A5D4TQ75_9BACI|nr:GNAT family N-acetyltransferase [Rossellomorea aquimaris]TYS76988.1 GNAT family N-acetyltransferase [Rossellomorea aquimaris]
MAIQSERLIFRPYTDKDFDFLVTLLSDPEMMRFIGNGSTRDDQGSKEFLAWIYRTYEAGESLGLQVLVRKEDGVPIGQAGLVPQKIEGENELEIGYWIARKYWGNGYATEAAAALLEHGRSTLGIQRFISLIQPDNTASAQVAQKIGMLVEKEIVLGGKDVNVFSTT